jgi:hypothetical protein
VLDCLCIIFDIGRAIGDGITACVCVWFSPTSLKASFSLKIFNEYDYFMDYGIMSERIVFIFLMKQRQNENIILSSCYFKYTGMYAYLICIFINKIYS